MSIVPHYTNYPAADGPLYTGSYASVPGTAPDELVVVDYNVQYGEAITELVQAFQKVSPLPLADIVLLQEMDAPGVDAVARQLGYNYVYFPASVARDGDDFGNAILSRWPISSPTKLILPGTHPLTGQQRTATRAVVRVGSREVLAYSTHLEVVTAPAVLRAGQVAALVADVPVDADAVVMGGDFNVVTPRGVSALVGTLRAGGLDHSSAGNVATVKRFGVRFATPDHLFTRGFILLDHGVLAGVKASDHYPVWVRLGFQSE